MLLKGQLLHNVVVLYENATMTNFSVHGWSHRNHWCKPHCFSPTMLISFVKTTACTRPTLLQSEMRDLLSINIHRSTPWVLFTRTGCEAQGCSLWLTNQHKAAVQAVPKPYNGSINSTNSLPQALTCSLCNAETLISDGVDRHEFITLGVISVESKFILCKYI